MNAADDILDTLTEDQEMIALLRAFKSIGVDARREPDGGVTIMDEDVYDASYFFEQEDFRKAFQEELQRLAIDNVFASLRQKGAIQATGVDDDGEITYGITEKGRRMVSGCPSSPNPCFCTGACMGRAPSTKVYTKDGPSGK